MKKSIIFTLFFLLTFSPAVLAAQRPSKTTTPIMQLQTNYPSPIGNYKKLTSSYLQLNPLDSPDDTLCDSDEEKGTLYFNKVESLIYYCNGATAGWVASGFTLWTKDTTKKSIYPIDIADEKSEYKLGLGTTDAPFLLTLGGSGGILSKTTCAKMTGTFPNLQIEWTCDNLPDQTGGEIFAWHPKEIALRAGSFDDDWDINIGYYSIAFGFRPEASETASTVSGGYMNTANNTAATVGGGSSNKAYGEYSVVSGGSGNQTGYLLMGNPTGQYNSVSGGQTNKAKGNFATISGGQNNTIESTATYATISGGANNQASGNYSTVSGGGGTTTTDGNIASGDYSTISGGYKNIASGPSSTVAGGHENTASDTGSIAIGGYKNTASDLYSTVAGGSENTASGLYSIVAGGYKNTANGQYSSVAGGYVNTAAGDYSFAGGRNMQLSSDADHTFVWGYSTNPLSITAADRFLIFPNSSGRVGIGTTSPNVELQVKGSIFAEDNIDANDSISCNSLTVFNSAAINNDLRVTKNVDVYGSYKYEGSCLAGDCKSDIRLKDKIQPLSDSLEKISQLRPVTFEFIDKKYGNGTQHGLIAQEVEKVFPDWVSTGEDGYKNINYGLQIEMHLIEAVKELKAEVDILKEQNQQLQKRLREIIK